VQKPPLALSARRRRGCHGPFSEVFDSKKDSVGKRLLIRSNQSVLWADPEITAKTWVDRPNQSTSQTHTGSLRH